MTCSNGGVPTRLAAASAASCSRIFVASAVIGGLRPSGGSTINELRPVRRPFSFDVQ